MSPILLPEDLNCTPGVEDKEHYDPVLHFNQASENDKQDDIPPHHLWT